MNNNSKGGINIYFTESYNDYKNNYKGKDLSSSTRVKTITYMENK